MRLIDRMEGLDIKEVVTEAEGEALVKLAESVAHEGMLIAEVGSWKGFSTAYLASVAKSHNGHVLAVDHWKGNINTWNIPEAGSKDIFSIFRYNMKVLGFEDVVIPLMVDSSKVRQFINDSLFDFVFIDGDHRATPFGVDISIWLAKLRGKGIISGHDCELKYSTLTKDKQDFVMAHREEDHAGGMHCGIISTLYEVFGDAYKKVPDTRIWWV